MRLKPNVHLAVCGDDVVILDIVEDAYLLAPGAARRGGRALRRIELLRDAEIARMLGEGGYTREGSGAPEVGPARAATRDIRSDPRAPVGLGDLVAFLTALASVAARGPRQSLLARVERARRRRNTPIVDRAPSEEGVRRVNAFFSLLVWTPGQGECVFRSELLLRYLHVRGDDATWMFGVQTWPFRAHCWLEAGGVVLTDGAEGLLALTPILAV